MCICVYVKLLYIVTYTLLCVLACICVSTSVLYLLSYINYVCVHIYINVTCVCVTEKTAAGHSMPVPAPLTRTYMVMKTTLIYSTVYSHQHLIHFKVTRVRMGLWNQCVWCYRTTVWVCRTIVCVYVYVWHWGTIVRMWFCRTRVEIGLVNHWHMGLVLAYGITFFGGPGNQSVDGSVEQ